MRVYILGVTWDGCKTRGLPVARRIKIVRDWDKDLWSISDIGIVLGDRHVG